MASRLASARVNAMVNRTHRTLAPCGRAQAKTFHSGCRSCKHGSSDVDRACAAEGVACSQLVNPPTGKCLTKITVSGAAIGLDAGTKYTVAQALPCKEPGHPSQTFDVVRGDQGGFPEAFPIRSPAVLDDEDETNDHELCLQASAKPHLP